MTWCDRLASVPSVGLLYEAPQFMSGDSIIDALSPILSRWHSNDKPQFTVSQTEPLKIEFQHDDGFGYSFEPTKFSIAFQHKVKFRNVSGGKPVAEFISSPKHYTFLLDTAIERLVEISALLPNAKRSSVKRIGVVTTTHADEEVMPPGVRRILAYLKKPWKNAIDAYHVTMVAEIADTKDWSERCIHTLARTEDVEQIPQFKFDWQRTLKHPVPIETENLSKELDTAKRAALGYFEAIGIGGAYDVGGDNQ